MGEPNAFDSSAWKWRHRQRVLAALASARRRSLPPPLSVQHPEVAGPDGIRHGLVARVRAAIAAGYYDDPELWEVVEERFIRRISSGTD